MEIIQIILSVVVGGGAIGAAVGFWTFRSRVKKVRNETQRDSNDTTRDNIKLNQEILEHVKVLSNEIADLTAKAFHREQELLMKSGEIELMKMQQVKERQRLEQLNKMINFYKENCKCQLEIS